MIKFFDTSSLLLVADKLFQEECQNEKIIISSISLKELENIKNSNTKDPHIKYSARNLLRKLNDNPDKFICEVYRQDMEHYIIENSLEVNNDTRILATAVYYLFNNIKIKDQFRFITNDLSLKMQALLYFNKNMIESIDQEDTDNYKGYLNIQLTDEEMANFYSNPKEYGEKTNLLINQYLNIYNKDNQRVDTLCWTGEDFRPLKYKTFSSKQLGNIKPYKDDIYQAMVADSLLHNRITIVKGPAGTGKSHISLGYLFYLLEKGEIDKIIIFCNTVATKNSARLGFYPGSKNEKLLDSQIGNFLSSKLGGDIGVESLIENNSLVLLPMSDIRGYDTSGMNAGIYITEAQNLDVDLLKLALQRVGEDSIIILDGDVKSQVDLVDYEGSRNGMRRASQVFRGTNIYGEVELQKIHRSRIAEIANLM